MAENWWVGGKGVLTTRTLYHIVVLLLVQFLFKFAQGQGPGTTEDKQIFSISENMPPGTYVGTILTKPTYLYSFNDKLDKNPIEKDYFILENSTGVITSKVEIDRELLDLPGHVFNILIIAKSSSQATYPVEVSITVLDKNDNSPYFPKAIERESFYESSPKNSQVHINTAIDDDIGINAEIKDYAIISGDGPFKIVYDPINNGEILIIETTGKLDRETRSEYELEIIAKDSGSPQLNGTVRVYITILDNNDNYPVFAPSTYYASVNETDEIDTLVIHVVASDRDAGINQAMKYSFIETSSYTSQFRIDENTGEIVTAKQPLQCPKKSCLLTVVATDLGTPSFTGRAFVFVTVVDVNNHDPVITFKYVPNGNTEFSSVNEDAKDGDTVAGIVTSDADSGEYGQVTVKIVAGNELQHFRLQALVPPYHFLRVNGDSVLDRERHSMYNLTFEASDDGSPPRTTLKSLVIYINDINAHRPVFVNKYVNLSISETTDIGSFVADMRATDADSGVNAILTYTIVSGNDQEQFHINPETGLVTTVKTLHYEVDHHFKMNVSVHDGAVYPFYDSAELEIWIWDENDMTPLFSDADVTVELDENLPSGAPIVSASAHDNDSGFNGTILYVFHPHMSRYPNTFHLDSATGSVTTTKSLDRESIPEYIIQIIAKDQGVGPLSSTATVTLKVRDVNDNQPHFYPKLYFAEVMEGQGQNVEVAQVTASDPDEGDNAIIEYSISGSDFGKFSIDSAKGIIKTTQTLTKQVRSKYTLTILAREKIGQRSDSATVEISVVAPTDVKPTFSKSIYTFSIDEDHGNTPPTHIGSNIGSVSAQSGSSATVVYKLVNGDPAHVFLLDPSSGWIKRAAAIDRETYPSFSLQIVGISGYLFATTVVHITVRDENDNAPSFEFPSLEVDVFEDRPVGHQIVRISASDADLGVNSRITYSIQTNQKNVFGINAQSGILYLNKPVSMLGALTARLTVVAMDSGSPQYSTTQELYLTIRDVNDHSPKFEHTTYEMSLLESQHVNDRFFHLKTTDADLGENGHVTYNITRGNEDNKFGIFPDGFLYIAQTLDRETKDMYKLSVIAKDHNKVQPRSSECNITIHISDFNDNNPMFINATYSFNVFENKPPGTTIGSVLAMDADMGRNAELTYYLSTSERNFKLDSQTGEITTLKSFDREELLETDSTFTFDVTVKDNGLTRLEDTVTVRVEILDENDSPPVFRKSVYKLNVFENAGILSNITVIKADDEDAGINGIVTYMITDGNDEDKFRIGQTTGQIVLNGGLDRETEDSYKLTVVATDSGTTVQHSATTLVKITVLDINDNFPLFAQTSMEIIVKEDVLPGTMVVHFLATDIDLGVNGDIRYSMSGLDNDGTFAIDEHTGKIYLSRTVDYENKRAYNLNITATDRGSPSLPYYVRFKITIEDVNDNYPVWPANHAQTFRILEYSSGSVGFIQKATDADTDENGEVQYTITFQDPPGDHFKIVANTGQIYIDSEVDRETADMYSLTIQASDQAIPDSNRLTSETVVPVFIDDINDHDPEFVSFNAIKVPKDTPKNEFLSTIIATDEDIDINGQISLQIVQGNGNYFGLESNSGRFYLANTLPSTPLKYDLKINASDYGNPGQRRTQFDITVIVTDNTEGPDFQQVTYAGSVLESEIAGTSILQVQATSRSNSNVEYYVTNITDTSSGSQVGRYFKIDKSSGELSTAVKLDRESMGNEFDVEIYAIEASGDRPRTSVKTARVQLLDENDTPPRFSKNIYVDSVDEDVAIGYTVTEVTVYDEDSVGGLQLAITEGNDGRLKIKQDGSIVTTDFLDYETTPQYTLKISANDGVQSSTCIVRLNINDKNDNAPQFESPIYSFDVPEDTPMGTTVGSVRAHDPDKGVGGVVTYNLTSDWGRSMFELDHQMGTLKLLQVLDFEETQLYPLVVSATDGGNPSQNGTVIVYINVKDTNDNTPLFEHATYDRAIYENVGEEASIVQVLATDVDSGINGDVSYSIIEGDLKDQFRIDALTGIIYSTEKLDRETTPSYTLVVMATDMAEPVSMRRSADIEVLITLKDINDFVPKFVSSSVIEVMENTPQDTVVHSVIVKDKDEGTNRQVEFSISATGGGVPPFALGTNDGKLRVNTDLDRETVQNYTMTITVKDHGNPTLSASQKLLINIGDDNDHTPVFSPESYDKVVKEDVPIGTILLPVSATDMDAGLNGIVRYFIIGGDDNNDFSLDQSSGVLRVQKSLDFERTSTYNLIVQGEDSGSDMRSSSATVSISVLDINDNKPIFLDLPYIGYVREEMEALPVHVKTVEAVDYDSSPYNQLQYAIRGSNHGMFNITADTGEIKLWEKVDRETTDSYLLTVIATDSAASRGLTGTCTVTIYVEDINDNVPMFEYDGTYTAHIMENMPADSEVIVVKATDHDEGVNAQIIYSLKDNMDNKFSIFPDTGRIATMTELDREDISMYTLEVVARDASILPLSSTTTVRVYIDDDNDNAPMFEHSEYTQTVLPPVVKGKFILGVASNDSDIMDNRLVTYSLSHTDYGFFDVDPVTGVITAKQSLTNGRTYSFDVTSTDKGDSPMHTTVKVTVHISSSAPSSLPTFTAIPTGLHVKENLPIDQSIAMVTATSSTGVAISYHVAGGNIGNAFAVIPDSGEIYVGGVIDYEVVQEYHLWIEARQEGSVPGSKFTELIIGVDDENDNSPRFSQTLYNASVSEALDFGDEVLTVTATDIDSGNSGNVQYSLAGKDGSKFRVAKSSGSILLYTELDRETVDSYSFTVLAVDQAPLVLERRTSSASVIINVLDENDNPPKFTQQFRVKIPENTEVGSFVLRVTSTDADIGDNAVATYTLKHDQFAIGKVSGNITLLRELDAETKSSYGLRVMVSDGSHDIESTVEIEVSDVNDNDPQIQTPHVFSFPEQQPAGSLVGLLIATDADIESPNNQIYFSLKLPSNYFDLNSDNGTITSREELEYHHSPDQSSLVNRHELVVLAKDLGTPARSSEVTVYINVVDDNDYAPQFEMTSYFSAVPESAEVDQSILKVMARDDHDYGENAQVEYYVTGGTGASLFKLNRYLGTVSVATNLIGTRNREFTITVKAQDMGTPPQSSTVEVRLAVTDVNLQTPSFTQPIHRQKTIPENKTVGSLIETFIASDGDTGYNAEILYSITDGNDDGLFEMDIASGILSVNKTLDYEDGHEYMLRISARDRALFYKETTIDYQIRLSDVNDNNPVFSQAEDSAYVDENSPHGTTVYHAIATDDDSGANAEIKYAIVANVQAQAKFHINEDTGIITSKAALDYESRNVYTVTVMALNPDSSRKSAMILTVHLNGENEYIPQFVKKSYYYSISESAPIKTEVGFVSATDDDTGLDGIIYYFLVGSSNSKGFKIKPKTGEIYVSGRPDYESSPRITLTVLAKNWGSVKGNDTDTCTVHISVEDANDPPVFTQEIYTAYIPEGSGAGVSVYTVTAEDYDVELSDRQFTYMIMAGPSASRFHIDSQTGYIETTGVGLFDREAVPIYNITVGAVDTGSPPETGSAIVQIHLDDINDNGPQFVDFTATVAENQTIGTLVTTLTQYTVDPDGPNNRGPYSYKTVSAPEYNYFDVNKNTGAVKTKRVLDREVTPEFTVPIIVEDGGTPTKTSTLTFKIKVTDINDMPPTQRFLTVFVSLYDQQFPTNVIADVKPLDQDVVGQYECTLKSNNIPFRITPSTCDLLMNEYPKDTSYTLQISGHDSLFKEVSYDVSVKIARFDNVTLDHTTIVQLAMVSADDFMATSYTHFISSVQALFQNRDEVFLYGIMQQNSGNLLLYIVVRQENHEYYYSDILKQRLSTAKNNIQSDSNVVIMDVSYSECQASSCKNSGECVSHVIVSSTNEVADSAQQSMSNPTLSLRSTCQCPPQFTGPDCGEPASQCGATYCQNGGSCINTGTSNTCHCPDTWTGTSCEQDVNECAVNICQNNARCENTQGSFTCHCRDGFSGKFCEGGFDHCAAQPCRRGTCRNVPDDFECDCPYGYWGTTCEYSSRGFNELSYMEFPKLTELNNEIEVIFATSKQNALLLYNPSSDLTSTEFIALEILNGRITFTVSLGTQNPTIVTIDKDVATGDWFKVKVNRNRATCKVWVEECPSDGGPCVECQLGNPCYGQGTPQSTERLELGTQPLTIGGIKDINTILERGNQVSSHDFVGCMRYFRINGQDMLTAPVESVGISDTCPRSSSDDVCYNWQCKNGGVCFREWAEPVCRCTPKFAGDHCETELEPFGFSANSMVRITPRESYRRDQLLNENRRRRALPESSVLVRFRTTANDGLLLFTSTFGGNKYSALSVMNGRLQFTVSQYGAIRDTTLASPVVNDGEWHNASVLIAATEITLQLDGDYQEVTNFAAFPFTSLDVKELSLGGSSNVITIGQKSIKDFDGCVSVFKLDGGQLPMNGSVERYSIDTVGGVENGCSALCDGNACDGRKCSVEGEVISCAASSDDDGPLSIGVIVVIIFFAVLIVVIIIIFVVFRYRRQYCMKGKDASKQTGLTLSKTVTSNNAHSPQDSGYGENNIDELIIRNHIAQELAGNKYHHQNGRLMRPDIIESDLSRSPLPLEMEDGTVIIDNASDLTHLRDLNGEMPEHYDLENASSIAPSDIDVVDHYRHFHDGGKHRRKKAQSNHSNPHSHHSQVSSRHYHSDNPAVLSSVPFMNDNARTTPTSRLSPMNQLSRQSPNVRNSPLTHVNMHGQHMPVTDLNTGSRTASERSLASHRSKNSTPQKPKRQMLPNGRGPHSNNIGASHAKKVPNHNYENQQFLTLEEVARLNSRPHESPASMQEAFSTSSDNNTRNQQQPFTQYHHDNSVLLEPPESSSDDSANDSFTCSEFEYDNDKQRNDFDPRNRIFSNLAEVDNENEELAYHNKTFKGDGLDSGGNSFSSNGQVSSDDNHAMKVKAMNAAFNWDDLLNWGPKFEKLVGVFTDIALLPDGETADFADMDAKATDGEEYV